MLTPILPFSDKKFQLRKKAEMAEKTKIAQETKEYFERLQMLEAQRNAIINELEEAKDKVLKIEAPKENIEDLAAIAALPESPEEELETLAQVAEVVINSEADIDPKLKESLEEKIMENIVQVVEEAKIPHFVSGEEDYEDQFQSEENEEERVKQFLEENDIMESSDPFSQFLKAHM